MTYVLLGPYKILSNISSFSRQVLENKCLQIPDLHWKTPELLRGVFFHRFVDDLLGMEL